MKSYWRRVWVYDLSARQWNVRVDESLTAYDPFNCTFGEFTWCKLPQPYIYEQWWQFIQSTIGTSQGSWSYLGGRVNWGSDVAAD